MLNQGSKCIEQPEKVGERGCVLFDAYRTIGWLSKNVPRLLGCRVVPVRVRFASLFNPLAYDPNGLAAALRGGQQAHHHAKHQTNDEPHILPPS